MEAQLLELRVSSLVVCSLSRWLCHCGSMHSLLASPCGRGFYGKLFWWPDWGHILLVVLCRSALRQRNGVIMKVRNRDETI
eukprot:5189470-Amphidinium_carterae.1